MRHILSFETDHGDPESGVWQYQVMELDSLGKVQLWYKPSPESFFPQVWEIGHSKEIPADLSAESVADIMRDFITGVIDSDEYNALLPR
ncbi:hypothetical protein SEA_STEPHIG9_98 [Mycobacterium phage Stephig9]|uniref:Uncharacterized protein n=1 Tax=Mycobacterium phage Stephig9 TaxID=2591224 RepID=A0A514DHG5_9CAUD|nr:hypothetical protein SEA_STEPHIG9_98 [Mycobacterium phage Stephig9]